MQFTKTCLILAIVFISGLWSSLNAQQYLVRGRILDAKDHQSLPQAHVLIVGENGKGAVADFDGNYTLFTDKKDITLEFKFLGYQTQTHTVSFKNGEKEKVLNIDLAYKTELLQAVQVTGSKYRADSKTSIQTLEVVNTEFLDKINAPTLDKALNNVAGLAIVDNEPQMRGGSGYSSGMGSRVMLLLDEIPILRADAGRPTWNLIPMEDISQIEILKGASSVLFGSAAINGAINVRTNYAKVEPETKFKLYVGAYSKPKKADLAPWKKGAPLTYGASLSHSRKIKNKFDLTFSAEFANDDGFKGTDKKPSEQDDNELVRKEMRFRANIGTQYRITPNWTVALNGNIMYSENAMTNFWYNATDGLYRAYPNTLSMFKDLIFFIDPHVKYVHPNGGVHSFDNRVMYSDNFVTNIEGQDAFSRTVFDSYQYKKTFKKAGDLGLIAGASNQYAYSFGEVFSGDTANIGKGMSGHHFADNFALFAKLEKSFLKNKNLSLELGARWEFAFVDDWNENKPVFQFGINYEIPKSHTFFRGSVGQGYRAATIGEKFITTKVGKYGFYPNPELKSETSLNSEIGIRQMYKFGPVEGFIDVAGFHQIYNNYIEFFMGPWNPYSKKTSEQFGFKFFNTGKATISGAEATLALQSEISDIMKIQLNMNYTYSLPICRDTGFIYTSTNVGKPQQYDYTYNNSSSIPESRILKYRIQHMAKLDLNLTFIDMITIGLGVQYMSAMKNVDRMLVEWDRFAPNHGAWLDYMGDLPFDGMQAFMEEHKNGSWIFDIRVGVDIQGWNISLIMNNLLNTEYSLRPLCIESPRLTTLQIIYKFRDFIPEKSYKRNKSRKV